MGRGSDEAVKKNILTRFCALSGIWRGAGK